MAIITLAFVLAFVPHAWANDLKPGSTEETDAKAGESIDTAEMFRLYNPNSGEHFYTASVNEKNGLKALGWRYEGIGWIAPMHSKTPVYRLYSGTDHHYTASTKERNALLALGWKDEGVGWYSDDAHTVAILRVFNPNIRPSAVWNNSGSHHYMTSEEERNHLTSVGWQNEGVGWYACAQGSSTGDWVGALNIAGKVNQIIAVEARGTRATVSLHVKQNGAWSKLLSTADGWVGKSGIGPAREGIDYTPKGVMYPTEAFGNRPNPGCPMGYLQVNESHYWCGDSESPHYNTMVSIWNTDEFSEYESEHIVSCGATYNYCLNMGWNTSRTPYGGSAFFLHCSQGKLTQGCVTVPESTMVQILRAVKPGCAMVIDTPSGIMRY